MDQKEPVPFKPLCPKCKTRDEVYLFDRGWKLFFRSMTGNNRFACRECKIAWRKKSPSDYSNIKRIPL